MKAILPTLAALGVLAATPATFFMISPVFAEPRQEDFEQGNNLDRFHPGCNSFAKSRTPDCAAAIHRYCAIGNRGGAGMPQHAFKQEFGHISVSCFKPSWYGNVSQAQLTQLHPGCNSRDKSQGPDCMSAVHRWCSAGGKGGAGLVQELGKGIFGVACFQPTSYQDVPLTKLQALDRKCDGLGKSQSPECLHATHRWCNDNRKGTAGLSQEVGNGVFGVACLNSTSFKHVSVGGVRFDNSQ
jgi:hypothetical protein